MRELTIQEMAEADGGSTRFFAGVLCGVAVAAFAVGVFTSFPIAALATATSRTIFYAGGAAACATAFAV